MIKEDKEEVRGMESPNSQDSSSFQSNHLKQMSKQTIDLATKFSIMNDVDNGISYNEIKRRYNLKSSANICVSEF